jgi:DNA-binding beta-propeller fold protein YncE
MRSVWLRIGICICLAFGAGTTRAQQLSHPKVDLPGQRSDGSVLLPNQWSLRPAGRQVDLGDFPVNIAVHPDGRFAAILHSGHGAHEIVVVDLKTATAVSRVRVNEAFYGIEFAHSGSRLYCSGSSDEVVHVFDFRDGKLTENSSIPLRNPRYRGIPCGMAVSEDARYLFVANLWGQRISQVDLIERANTVETFFAPGEANKVEHEFDAKEADPDLAATTKRAEAQNDPTKSDAPFPYACRLDEKRRRLYVSLWAKSSVAVIDLDSHKVIARWQTEEHPNEMVLSKSGRHLFVANANRNTVSVLDTITGRTVETLHASLSPEALVGSTPNSLALSPDETKLFVANACNNNVAVFDVSFIGRSHSLGFIPVGWYPTSVRVTPDGRQLLVANGKGLTSRANPHGPMPGRKQSGKVESIAELFPGTLSIIDLPRPMDFAKQLAAYTEQAYLCTPQHSVEPVSPQAENPVISQPDKPSPIKYVIYIIRENRTYDQVFGDVAKGNGDTNLCLFGEQFTPNAHALINEFVLLDNFYADAEVSADGHEWSMAAYASDFVEKTWPLKYGHGKGGKFPYPAEGRFPIAASSGGYLWDKAKEAGVDYRSYGEFVFAGKTPGSSNYTRLPALEGHFDPFYRVFDTGYSDLKRADRFISELERFEGEGEMPRLQIVRLPNDHTTGTLPGSLTPTAYLAQNDRALGMLVEAVSHSKFWPKTAIFVVEDDAQNGSDHVDAHRTVALAISPYVRRHSVDSTMYSTTSMLRTMELILGLSPMTQFDLAATPMYNSFQETPDLKPFESLPPNIDLNERNKALAWGSSASKKMDFSKEDAADDNLLNEIIWRSVRGADHPMPAPHRAAFVLQTSKPKDDD